MARTPLKLSSTSLSSLLAKSRRSRAARSWQRFSFARGPILAAGISYTALFSLTAAITVGWTTLSTVMANPDFRASVIEAANATLPGLFQTDGDPGGLVDPDFLVATPSTSIAGAIALVATLSSATTVVLYLSRSIRSMFGLGTIRIAWHRATLQRMVGLLALFLGLLSAAALTSLSTFLHRTIEDWLDDSHSDWLSSLFSLATVIVPFVVDFVVFIVMVRWVASVRPPRRDLLAGATLAAAGATGLRVLSSFILSSVSGPILTTATTLITLAVWVNLLAVVYLLACAWTANPPLLDVTAADALQHATDTPNYVTLSAPETLSWSGAEPTDGS